MTIGKSIILYTHPGQPIFIVEHLSAKAFGLGFRVLNPEIRTSPHQLAVEQEKLDEFLDSLDSAEGDVGHYFELSKKDSPLSQAKDPNNR
jgi:hypothetical protein